MDDHGQVERLRETVYGTIVLLSVLAVLSEHEHDAGVAALSVAGTSLVLFFAHVYAGAMAERIRLGGLPKWERIGRLAANSWPIVAVTAWPLVLLAIAKIGVIDTADAIVLAMWLCVAALGVWGWRAGQIGRASVSRRLLSAALDTIVGPLTGRPPVRAAGSAWSAKPRPASRALGNAARGVNRGGGQPSQHVAELSIGNMTAAGSPDAVDQREAERAHRAAPT